MDHDPPPKGLTMVVVTIRDKKFVNDGVETILKWFFIITASLKSPLRPPNIVSRRIA